MSTARVLALTQLLIIGLGAPLLHLLIKIQPAPGQPSTFTTAAEFLSRHVLWLFVVPILYAVVGTLLIGRIGAKPVQILGFVLCALLFLLVAIPGFIYLR